MMETRIHSFSSCDHYNSSMKERKDSIEEEERKDSIEEEERKHEEGKRNNRKEEGKKMKKILPLFLLLILARATLASSEEGARASSLFGSLASRDSGRIIHSPSEVSALIHHLSSVHSRARAPSSSPSNDSPVSAKRITQGEERGMSIQGLINQRRRQFEEEAPKPKRRFHNDDSLTVTISAISHTFDDEEAPLDDQEEEEGSGKGAPFDDDDEEEMNRFEGSGNGAFKEWNEKEQEKKTSGDSKKKPEVEENSILDSSNSISGSSPIFKSSIFMILLPLFFLHRVIN